jgi:hypothetical protein
MKKKSGAGIGWTVVLAGGRRMSAEQVRCLLAGRGLHPLVLNRHVPTSSGFFGVPTGAHVIVPPHESEPARDILRDAGLLKGDLPLRRVSDSRSRPKAGGGRACGFCDAPADAGSIYCDQCGQPLTRRR